MKQYLQIMKATWAEYMTYRLNFVLWRVRMVMGILVTYFLWWAIFSNRSDFAGYSQSMMLTYILFSLLVRTIALSSTIFELGSTIHSGTLSNLLIRPIHVFSFSIARDMADKAMNIVFAIGEVGLLYLILRPHLFIQHNVILLLLAFFSIGVGMVLYFLISLVLGFIGFWSADVWAPRFLFFVLIEFFAGGLFPLDILPRPLATISQSLPFAYFIYFPLKVYLGQLSLSEVLSRLSIGFVWIIVVWYLAQIIWRKGLRVYTAVGR